MGSRICLKLSESRTQIKKKKHSCVAILQLRDKVKVGILFRKERNA